MNHSSNEIKLTVICETYNQERYIRQCLDSLVNQNANFRYQIVVHDDASNDSTTQIILDYANRYPDLIIPIIQKKNLYSQGKSDSPFIASKIKGKYLAFCEGDDWWLSSDKLQVQYDYMEQHPDCSLCVHDAKLFDDNRNCFIGNLPSSGPERDITVKEIIENGGWYLGTNTMLFKAEDYVLPKCYLNWGVGDYPRAIYLGIKGRVHFLSEVMAVHRVNAAGSWTKRTSEDIKIREAANKKIINGLKAVDIATNRKFHDSFDKAEFMLLKQIEELHHNLIKLMFGTYSSRFWDLDITEIVKSISRCILPRKVILIAKLLLHR